MCGRVRLSSDYSEIKIRLKFAPNAPAPNFKPDWNKPPTEPMLVAIRSVDGERIPKMMKWGLIPHWAKDDKLQYSTFNARSEDFRTRPSFRDAWAWGQRCLVVTDGFYEWPGKGQAPFLFHRADDGLVLLGGLFQRPRGDEVHPRFTVLTTRPNGLVARVHDRMPVIVQPAQLDRWLGEPPADAAALIAPAPEETLAATRVSKHVNNVRNDDPGCVAAAEPA